MKHYEQRKNLSKYLLKRMENYIVVFFLLLVTLFLISDLPLSICVEPKDAFDADLIL